MKGGSNCITGAPPISYTHHSRSISKKSHAKNNFKDWESDITPCAEENFHKYLGGQNYSIINLDVKKKEIIQPKKRKAINRYKIKENISSRIYVNNKFYLTGEQRP